MSAAGKRCLLNRATPIIVSRKFEFMAKSDHQKSPLPAALPRWEIYLSFAVWIFNAVYAWYIVYQASITYKYKLYAGFFVPGWDLLNGRRKDEANYEWKVYRGNLYVLVTSLALHVIIHRFVSKLLAAQPRKALMLAVSAALLVRIHGPFAVAVSTVHGFAMLLSARVFKSVWIVLISACLLLSTLALEWYGTLDDERTYDLAVFVAYKLLEYISFCWYDVTASKRDVNSKEQDTFVHALYEMFCYSTYLPYSSVLIVPYHEYTKQAEQRDSKLSTLNYLEFGLLSLRVAFWAVVNDFVLHFFYMNAMMVDDDFLNFVDAATLSAIGYVAGQYFHMKYMAIFGVNAVFAKLDGMQPPWPPICISRVAFYSQMWRYFDRGLYTFLRSHIFVPIALPSFSLARRTLATFTCFAFVWLWHGTSLAFLCWVSLNFLEIMLENIGTELLRQPSVEAFMTKHVSPANRRRLTSCCSIVCVTMGIFSIFFFLGGFESGKVFLRRLFFDDRLSFQFFYLVVLGYFFGNVCSEIELWHRKAFADKAA